MPTRMLLPLLLALCVTACTSTTVRTVAPGAAGPIPDVAGVPAPGGHWPLETGNRPPAEADGYRPPVSLAVLLPLTGNLSTQTDAESAVAAVATAVTTLGGVQGQVGQIQNRLSYAISLAQSQIVNNKAAESRIRDANIAEESANLTRFSILNQSGIAALAQANGQTSAVLSLLRG